MPPGKVQRIGTQTTGASTPALGCDEKITLKNTGEAAALYTTPDSAALAKSAFWGVDVVVYSSASKASGDLARISAMYGRCPKTFTQHVGNQTVKTTIVSKTSVTVGAWKGFRLVRSVTIDTAGKVDHLSSVVLTLTRGNAIVEISELTPASKSAAAAQRAWLTTVQGLVLRKLAG